MAEVLAAMGGEDQTVQFAESIVIAVVGEVVVDAEDIVVVDGVVILQDECLNMGEDRPGETGGWHIALIVLERLEDDADRWPQI